MENKRNACSVLVDKSKGNRSLETPNHGRIILK
jgi:hypothetical protein